MKGHYQAFGGRLTLEVEGASVKELFDQIGQVAEVLDADDKCGACGSPRIYPRAREAKGFMFYELMCGECQAKLSFGQHKTGDTLFPKRDHAPKTRGWERYVPDGQSAPMPARSSQQSAPPPRPRSEPVGPTPKDLQLQNYLDAAAAGGSAVQNAIYTELDEKIIARFGDVAAGQFWDSATADQPKPEILIRRMFAKAMEGK